MDRLQYVAFDLDTKLPLSKDFSVKDYSSDKLVLFYELPNWVTFNDSEYLIFLDMFKLPIKNLLNKYQRDIVLDTIRKLVTRGIIHSDKKSNIKDTIPPLFIYITNKCNLRCKHCYMYSGEGNPDELALDQWKQVIKSYVNTRF